MSAVRHFRPIGQVLSCAVDFLGEAQRSVFGSKRNKEDKGRRNRGQPRHQSGGGPRENEYCLMLPSGGAYGHLQGSGGKIYLGGAWEGPLGDGSYEITCFFWSQPHRHWGRGFGTPLSPLHLPCSLPSPSFCPHLFKGSTVGYPNVFLKYTEDNTK